jgi:hypothetical protein
MAARMAAANGAFTAAGTWQTIDATAYLNSEANATALGLAYVESAPFTPGAITIDGIAVLIASRVAAPTGTFTIRLAQAGATVAGTELAINVSDVLVSEAWFNSAPSNVGGSGWYFFKFAAPVLLIVATAYTVSAKCSVAGEITLNRNATAGNWSRLLRTTAGGAAPAAGDDLWILGEWTAAATKTNRAVTMDSVANTDYGDGTAANSPGFCIGNGGTLTWNNTAATAYILQLSTSLAIHAGGTMTMGTALSPIPRGGSAVLQFDCGADGDFGLYAYGTFTAQGLSRTVGKIFDRCKLNGDEAAAQTTLSVDTDTGWLSGDEIALAPTTRTANQAETRVLNGAAGATTLAVTAGLTNAHSGTAPTQAEMILLTRNVKVVSVSTSFMSFVYCGIASTIDCDWVEFRYLGTLTGRKRGVQISTQAGLLGALSGSAQFVYCSLRNFETGVGFCAINDVGGNVDNFAISFAVGYLVGSLNNGEAAIAVKSVTTGTNWSITDCTIISGNASVGSCFYFASANGTIQRIVATGAAGGGIVVDLGTVSPILGSLSGTLSDWTAHSNTITGILLQNILGGRVSNLIAWRHSGGAQQAGVVFGGAVGFLELDGVTAFGNATANLCFTNAASLYGQLLIRAAVAAGDTTFGTGYGFQYPAATSAACAEQIVLENCTFGVVAGINVAHTLGDIDFTTSAPKTARMVLRNTLLASPTPILNLASVVGRGGVFYEKKQQVAGVNQAQYGTGSGGGAIDLDTGTFKTAAPSEKLTPAAATVSMKLRSQVRRLPVKSGQAMAVSVWVQKSAAYAGSQPRLRVLSNAAIGLNIDSTLKTATGAVSLWEQLTGTCTAATGDGVLEVYVDCDGNAGSVYVDDWAAAVA